MQQEAQTEKKTGDLFSSIGALVGLVAGGGNPLSAALGSGLGSLLSGGSMQDAFRSGIGSFLTGSTFGKAGAALDVLGNLGGGGQGASPQQRGTDFMNQLSTQKGQQQAVLSAMGNVGGPQTQAAMGIMQSLGITRPDGKTDPIMGALLQEMLYKQRRPRFENLMSKEELAQYRTGERNPNYTGTIVPGVPGAGNRIQRRAMGGFIEGPGTGKSDSIPAAIYQNGGRVQEARLSDGEFVMTADAVKGAGGGNRNAGAAKMYQMMNQFERMV